MKVLMERERELSTRNENRQKVLMFFHASILKISNLLSLKSAPESFTLGQLPQFVEQTNLSSSLFIMAPSFFYRVSSKRQITRLKPSAGLVQRNSLTGYGQLLITTGGVKQQKESSSSELYSLKTHTWKQIPSMLHSAQNHSSVLLPHSVLYCFTVELQVLKLNGRMQFESLECNTLRTFSMNHLKIVPQHRQLLLFGHPETPFGSKLYKFTEEGKLLKKQRSTIISEKKFELTSVDGKIYALGQKYLSVWNWKQSKFERLNK